MLVGNTKEDSVVIYDPHYLTHLMWARLQSLGVMVQQEYQT